MCEKRIEVIETLFSKIIDDIHNYEKHPNKFTLGRLGTQDFINCNDLNPVLYKLFLYSLVWRASISGLYECEPFKLDSEAEEVIRVFLHKNLAKTKLLLLQNASSTREIPKYHSCIIKPIVKANYSRGILSITSMSKTAHALFLIDFAIFFYTDETSVGNVLIHYSNKENENVIVALGRVQAWIELNQMFVTKMVNINKGA